jgi:hypothetical protein
MISGYIDNAEAVHRCLYWSGITSLCNEQRFVERVFDNIVSLPFAEGFGKFRGSDMTIGGYSMNKKPGDRTNVLAFHIIQRF